MGRITGRWSPSWRSRISEASRALSVGIAAGALALATAGTHAGAPGRTSSPVQLAQQPDSDGDGIADIADSCDGALPGSSATDAAGCPGALDDIYAGLSFDDSDHREWYERFWLNDCDGLSFGQWLRCWRGDDHWAKTTEDLIARVPARDRPSLRFRLWRLGRLVGHEWARHNDVRRIDTDDLQAWSRELKETADVSATVARIHARARGRLE